MSLDEIRLMIRAENATLLDAILQKLEGVIDARLAGQEARLMKEISALQKRTEQLELRDRAGNVGMEKSARDHASLRRHDGEERHTVVFSGFPAMSRKKLLIDYVKLQLSVVERLAGHTKSSPPGSVQVLECPETGRRGRDSFPNLGMTSW